MSPLKILSLFWAMSIVFCFLIAKIVAEIHYKKLRKEFSKEEIKNSYKNHSFNDKVNTILCLIAPFINLLIAVVIIHQQERVYEKLRENIINKLGK